MTVKQQEAVDALVAFFNKGANVAGNSIRLNIPSQRDDALAFFACREAVGMWGYLEDEEAKRNVIARLGL